MRRQYRPFPSRAYSTQAAEFMRADHCPVGKAPTGRYILKARWWTPDVGKDDAMRASRGHRKRCPYEIQIHRRQVPSLVGVNKPCPYEGRPTIVGPYVLEAGGSRLDSGKMQKRIHHPAKRAGIRDDSVKREGKAARPRRTAALRKRAYFLWVRRRRCLEGLPRFPAKIPRDRRRRESAPHPQLGQHTPAGTNSSGLASKN